MPLSPTTSLTAVTDQVRIVDPSTDPLFARLASVFPDATPFHGLPWAQTLIRAYGHRPFYHLLESGTSEDRSIGVSESRSLGASEHRNIGASEHRSNQPTSPHPSHRPTVPPSHRPTALLPLMEVSSYLTGRRAVSLPFTDLCPLLCSDEPTPAHPQQCLESLWPRIVELGRQRGWRTIELRGGPPPTPDAEPSISFHGHVLELTGVESQLHNGLHPSVRRAIRKAEQSDLQVQLSHALDALHDFYALHIRTRQRHGVPPQPFGFFLNLYDQVIANGNAFISIARMGTRAIAGAIFLHAGRWAVFKYGASDPAHQSLRANDLLFWETIRQLAADGFAWLHFGRTDLDHEGLRRFKLGWGTREEPIHYYKFNLRTNAFVTDRDRPASRYATLFARLPLAVNRILGTLAYRHLD